MAINHEQIDDLQRECFRILRWSGNVNKVQKYDFEMRKFVPLNGAGGYWHRHPEVEITYVSSGQGLRMVGNETQEVNDSQSIVLLGSGLPHYWKFNGPSSGVCVQLSASRTRELPDEESKQLLDNLFERAKLGLEFDASQSEEAVEILRKLVLPDLNRLARYGLLLQLLGELSGTKSVKCKRLSTQGFHGSRAMANYTEMQQVISWIIENFKSPIQLQDAVDLVDMSRASFCRHFTACTGSSFANFVNDIRVSNACRLLHDSDKSIAAIALDSGFSNLSNFNRVFLRQKQMTPSYFRRNSRK
ncbi:MAG: AraC family transcriptional regulator [Pirellulaceae bacterium]|nr:AraC family transcriptional regulator [Pirellulaceae bacterium]